MITNKVDEIVENPKEAPQEIQKPITVARQDFIDGIVGLINNAGLPAFIIADILKDVQSEMVRQANTQYENDRAAFDEAMNHKD